MKNVIFDFGGVLLDIDQSLTRKAFESLGVKNFDGLSLQLVSENFFTRFEKGQMGEKEFYTRIRNISGLALSDLDIERAWNATLIGLPRSSTNLLERLKRTSRIFMLSNTNCIHEKGFSLLIEKSYGLEKFRNLFERIYFSHHLGMRKPEIEIFRKVIDDNDLNPSETLFLDDSPEHVEGARKAGLNAVYLEKGKKAEEYFT